jgi:hypothetical protein
MRRLVSLACLLSAVLVASAIVAGSGELSELQVRPETRTGYLAPVKFASDVPDLSPPSARATTIPQHSVPAAEAGAQTRIRLAARCGTSNYYCNPPTPVCCGSPGKYFCAQDASGCMQQPK